MFLITMAEPAHFDRWEAMTDSEQQAVLDAYGAFVATVRERGSVHYGDALARPDQAVTLRPGSAADRVAAPGPYTETDLQPHGIYVIEQPDLEAAVAAARLLPAPCSIEVRPLLDVYHHAHQPG
ncbi:hypothetical protein GCM10028864_64940 [Microlunatus parietis]